MTTRMLDNAVESSVNTSLKRDELTDLEREALYCVGRGQVHYHPVGLMYTGLRRRGFSPAVRKLVERGLVVQPKREPGNYDPIVVFLSVRGKEVLR